MIRFQTKRGLESLVIAVSHTKMKDRGVGHDPSSY